MFIVPAKLVLLALTVVSFGMVVAARIRKSEQRSRALSTGWGVHRQPASPGFGTYQPVRGTGWQPYPVPWSHFPCLAGDLEQRRTVYHQGPFVFCLQVLDG